MSSFGSRIVSLVACLSFQREKKGFPFDVCCILYVYASSIILSVRKYTRMCVSVTFEYCRRRMFASFTRISVFLIQQSIDFLIWYRKDNRSVVIHYMYELIRTKMWEGWQMMLTNANKYFIVVYDIHVLPSTNPNKRMFSNFLFLINKHRLQHRHRLWLWQFKWKSVHFRFSRFE